MMSNSQILQKSSSKIGFLPCRFESHSADGNRKGFIFFSYTYKTKAFYGHVVYDLETSFDLPLEHQTFLYGNS